MNIIHRGGVYFKNNSLIDLVRKCVYEILNIFIFIIDFFRKVRFYFFTKCWVKNVKSQIKIVGLANKITIGKDAFLYDRSIFELGVTANLTIGKNFTFSYGSLIACHSSILIGDYVMIGEYCSIRDTSHSYKQKLQFSLQPDISKPIIISNNVWIGRGCIILPGSVIENDVIIAANSVVKGLVKSGCIYGGSPAKFIKRIREEMITI